MTTIISDDELFTYAERAKEKVVILTGTLHLATRRSEKYKSLNRHAGGANGIGREVALAFSKYG